MILGHLAGLPFEEWVTPIAASAGGLLVAARAMARRFERRERRGTRR